MHQVQPLFDELCDPFSSTATLDGFSLSFLQNLSAFFGLRRNFLYRSPRPPLAFRMKTAEGDYAD